MGIPFKFNRIWLEDEEYISLIKRLWINYEEVSDLREWNRFHFKLQKIKKASKEWEIKKKKALKFEYQEISKQMEEIYASFTNSIPDESTFCMLTHLGSRKREILRIEEVV